MAKGAQIKDVYGSALHLSKIKPGSSVTVDYVKEKDGRFIPLEKYPVACHGVEHTSFNEGEGLIPRPSFLTGFIASNIVVTVKSQGRR